MIDYFPLLDFYLQQIWANISFLFTSQQSSIFFNLVGHSQRSLSNFSSDSFPFLQKFAYICLLLAETVFKTLLTSHSGWTLGSDHVCRSHHSMTSIMHLYSNHKSSLFHQSRHEIYTVHCIITVILLSFQPLQQQVLCSFQRQMTSMRCLCQLLTIQDIFGCSLLQKILLSWINLQLI